MSSSSLCKQRGSPLLRVEEGGGDVCKLWEGTQFLIEFRGRFRGPVKDLGVILEFVTTILMK